MTVQEMAQRLSLKQLAGKDGMEKEVAGCYIGDLLSWVMGRAQEGDAWITVMGNVNAIAVAVLADTACIVLAENAALDGEACTRADGQDVPVLRSPYPIFDTGLLIQRMLED